MAILTIVPGDKTVTVNEGTTLLAAIKGLGIQLAASDCGGNAKCGTCHIFVQDGRKGVSKASKAENEKLCLASPKDSMAGMTLTLLLAPGVRPAGSDPALAPSLLEALPRDQPRQEHASDEPLGG